MRLISACALALATLAHPALAQDSNSIEIRICDDQPDPKNNSWYFSSLRTIGEVLFNFNAEAELRVRRAPCNETMPDTSCAGIDGQMFCRQEVFDRMHIAASWIIGKVLEDPQNLDYETFRKGNPRAIGTAFRFADGAFSHRATEEKIETLRLFMESSAAGTAPQPASSSIVLAAALVKRITRFSTTAIIGHERFHLEGDTCPFEERSSVEKSGLFDHIAKEVQPSDTLFRASFPDPNEIKADRCAIRQIDLLLSHEPLADRNMENLARRLAADLIAFQTLFGFRKFAQLPTGQYTPVNLNQYLHPAHRVLLLASSLSNSTEEPRVCGDAASLYVTSIQQGMVNRPGNGDVSDQLLAQLPKGVEESWSGAPWTHDSFSCVSPN